MFYYNKIIYDLICIFFIEFTNKFDKNKPISAAQIYFKIQQMYKWLFMIKHGFLS